MSFELYGKLQNFDLSGGSLKGRQYIICDVNFLALKKYCKPSVYDMDRGEGSQRIENERHVNYLKQEITNRRYTPDSFTVSSANAVSIIKQDDGTVKIKIDEENPLSLLNGNHRKCALESLWKDNSSIRRVIENLPLPLIVLVDDKEQEKKDFINLNKNLAIDKSHLLNLRLDTGDVDSDKLPLLQKGRELIKLSNSDERSPFFRMVKFTSGSTAPLAMTSLLTTRRSDLLGSFYFSARLVELHEKTNEWFQNYLNEFYEYVKRETGCAETGNLLCCPPNGAKMCANLLLSAANMFCYYLYLHNRSKPLAKDYKVLNKALAIYNEAVDGDLSGLRRQRLAREFAEILFEGVANDDESNVAFHAGIPIPLIIMTSNSCFGVDSPGKILLTQVEKIDDEELIKPLVSPIYQIHMDSDTDTEWENENA